MIDGKKALSQIVAVVFIILLTVSSVMIVAEFAVPFVKKNLYASNECIAYKEYFKFDEDSGFSCYDAPSGGYKISVLAKADDSDNNIAGFKLVYSDGNLFQAVDVLEGNSPGSIKMLSDSSKNIEIPKTGETRSYLYTSSNLYYSVEVVPVLKSGRVCEKTDYIKIKSSC